MSSPEVTPQATRYDLGVWSELEGGDWEACVVSSYLEGCVYGGIVSFPLGVYTQAEREALEVVYDEPQDYNTTDGVAQARYGHHLRQLSTGSIADAVTRTGVGLVLAGYGGLIVPTNAPIHSVFYLPTSPTAGLLYDPLAANQSAGVPIDSARIVAWSKGAGPNDAREVRDSEFLPIGGGPMITALEGYPDGATVQLEAGIAYQLWEYDPTSGARASWAVTYASATGAGAEALVTLTGEPPAHFIPKIWDGARWHYNAYLGQTWASVVFPAPPEPPPPDGGDATAWETWYADRPQSAAELWVASAPADGPPASRADRALAQVDRNLRTGILALLVVLVVLVAIIATRLPI